MALLLWLAACKGGDSDGRDDDDTDLGAYALTLAGTGYAEHDGLTVNGRVVLGGDPVASASATIASGAFTLDFGDPVVPGPTYTLGWYVDLDADGACDPIPTDHVWQDDFGPVDADVALTHAHDTAFAACL